MGMTRMIVRTSIYRWRESVRRRSWAQQWLPSETGAVQAYVLNGAVVRIDRPPGATSG